MKDREVEVAGGARVIRRREYAETKKFLFPDLPTSDEDEPDSDSSGKWYFIQRKTFRGQQRLHFILQK